MTEAEKRRLKRMFTKKSASDALVTKGIDPAKSRQEENERAAIEDVRAQIAYVAMMSDIDLDDEDDESYEEIGGETEETGSDLAEDLSGEEEADNE